MRIRKQPAWQEEKPRSWLNWHRAAVTGNKARLLRLQALEQPGQQRGQQRGLLGLPRLPASRALGRPEAAQPCAAGRPVQALAQLLQTRQKHTIRKWLLIICGKQTG